MIEQTTQRDETRASLRLDVARACDSILHTEIAEAMSAIGMYIWE